MSPGSARLPAGRGFTIRQESVDGSWATASGLLPAVGRQEIARQWCGLEAQSFDDIPFIGAVPGYPGLTVATGFSGHGFALAPAVGRAVADQLAGRATPELDGLSPARIAAFDPEAVERWLADDADGWIKVG